MPLDDLVKDRGAVLDRLGEDLEQIALLVAVDQHPQLGQLVDRLVDLAHPGLQFLVVGARHAQELDPRVAQAGDRLDDVAGAQGEVLHPWAIVVVQVFLDLRLLAALGRLVDRELDLAVPVHHDLGHQGRVLGVNVVVAEVAELLEAHGLSEEFDPAVHRAQLDVADDVVDVHQAEAGGFALGVARARVVDGCVARRKGAPVLAPLDERHQGVAIHADRGGAIQTLFVLDFIGRNRAGGPAPGRLAIRRGRVGDFDRDHGHGVAVQMGEAGDRVIGRERAGQHQADVVLLEDI